MLAGKPPTLRFVVSMSHRNSCSGETLLHGFPFQRASPKRNPNRVQGTALPFATFVKYYCVPSRKRPSPTFIGSRSNL